MDIKRDKNQIIDDTLQKLYEVNITGQYFDVGQYLIKKYPINLDNLSESDRIIEILEHNDLLIKSSEKLKMLTAKGKDICESGGWIKFQSTKSTKTREIKSRIIKLIIGALMTILTSYIVYCFGWS
jgi:predicted transcriptional regulator